MARTNRTHIRLLLSTAVLSLFLTACGGGGGDSPTELPEEDDPGLEVNPGPDPEPIPGPDPEPIPGPDPEPVPGPDPEPIPGPDPEPIPGPDPEPIPGPDPEPIPGPDPEPIPGPDPEPIPGPEVDPGPVATSQDNFALIFDQAFIDANAENIDFLNFLDTAIGGAIAPFNTIDNVFFNSTIPVLYGACEQANAFYVPTARLIVLCQELTDLAFNFFLTPAGPEPTDDDISFALLQAINTMTFIMYHEMGHALDDIRDLPVGGNFESVADAIGVVLSVQTGQPFAAIAGGVFFLSSTGGSFSDEHGAGEDRAGDVLCWVLGSSSDLAAQFSEIFASFTEAGRDCVGEYQNQFQFVESLVPNLSSIPSAAPTPIASARSNLTQAEQDRFAELDKATADLLKK